MPIARYTAFGKYDNLGSLFGRRRPIPELLSDEHQERSLGERLAVNSVIQGPQLLFLDGIRWVEETVPRSLDMIIVDSTDPIGPGEVLFSPAFYAACHSALDDEGIIVQQSESPLIHQELLGRMYRDLLSADFADVRTLFFPQPIYPTGWWSATIGAKNGTIEAFREDEAEDLPFETRYYNAAIHRAAFAEPQFFRQARREWLKIG